MAAVKVVVAGAKVTRFPAIAVMVVVRFAPATPAPAMVIVLPTVMPAEEARVAEFDPAMMANGTVVEAIGCLVKYSDPTWLTPRVSYTVSEVELL